MISFKQYLNEVAVKPWVVKPVSQKLESLLAGNYSNFYDAASSGGLLFRGFKENILGSENFVTLDSTGSSRTSRDTNNLYQLLMDRSAALKGYPSRSNSIICSSSLHVAGFYGGGMKGVRVVVVPPNSAKVAQCSEADFLNVSLRTFKFEMSGLDGSLFRRFSIAGLQPDIKGNIDSWTDAGKLNAHLAEGSAELQFYMLIPFLGFGIFRGDDEITIAIRRAAVAYKPLSPEHEKYLKEYGANTTAGNLILEAFRSTKSRRFDALSTLLMTPETLDLSLIKPGSAINGSKECWFSGKALLIRLNEVKTLLQQMKKSGASVSSAYSEIYL